MRRYSNWYRTKSKHFVRHASDAAPDDSQNNGSQCHPSMEVPEALIVTDLNRNITAWNRGAEKIYGWSAGEVYGKNVDELLQADGHGSGWNVNHRCKNGHNVAIDSLSLAFESDGSGASYWVIINRDISARNHLEQESKHAREQLEQSLKELTVQLDNANHEMESFSFSVSHDLRAPLRHIDGYSQALVEDCYEQLDSTGKNYIERIRKSTHHLNELIDAILTLSRLGRAELTIKSVNLSGIAIEILEELRLKSPERHVDVVVERDLVVRGDPRLLKIALQNLLENAWKFTGRTEQAHIQLGVNGRKGARTIFVIRDNGAGFNMAQIDKLFGAFQRMHTINEFPGIGIGLAIVKRIISRHGGEVWAEGREGQGATFYFTL